MIIRNETTRRLPWTWSCWLLLVAVITVPVALFAATSSQTALKAESIENAETARNKVVGRENLTYAGKSFHEWDRILVTDLDPNTQVEALTAIRAFAENGFAENALPRVVDVLSRAEERKVLSAALAVLEVIGPPAVPELVKALKHDNHRVRRRAALSIAKLGPSAEAALPRLLHLIESGDYVNSAAEHFVALRSVGVSNGNTRHVLLKVAHQARNPRDQREAWRTLVSLDKSAPAVSSVSKALVEGNFMAARGVFDSGDAEFTVKVLGDAIVKMEMSTNEDWFFALRMVEMLLQPSLRNHSTEYQAKISEILKEAAAARGATSTQNSQHSVKNSILLLADAGEMGLPILKELLKEMEQEQPNARGKRLIPDLQDAISRVEAVMNFR